MLKVIINKVTNLERKVLHVQHHRVIPWCWGWGHSWQWAGCLYHQEDVLVLALDVSQCDLSKNSIEEYISVKVDSLCDPFPVEPHWRTRQGSLGDREQHPWGKLLKEQ